MTGTSAAMTRDCYYFGCWNKAGHYLFGPHDCLAPYAGRDAIVSFGGRHHLDGSLAPRRHNVTMEIVWGAMPASGRSVKYQSEELEQGRFLRHVLDNGFTAIQWWDRSQGDTRGACNSTILRRGTHGSKELLAVLAERFPTVLANLTKAGIELVEVPR